MTVGNTPLGTDQMPLPTVIVPGNNTPVLTQGSTLTNTDGNDNTTTPVNINLKQIADALFTLGQALKIASIPVVLPSDQIVSISLATTIAGEDIANDRLKTSNEVVISNTLTHNVQSILNGSVGTTTNAVYSNPINSANYRKYAIAGWGANGNVQLLLQVSYDGGSTWLWHSNGFTGASQFALQQGDIVAPLCRLAAVNVSGGTQNVNAYLCLAR